MQPESKQKDPEFKNAFIDVKDLVHSYKKYKSNKERIEIEAKIR